MSRIVTPTQFRYNDPYSQRMLQYDIADTKLYLSRISNLLLKSLGDNAIIRGFELLSTNITGNIITLTISPGLLIQDATLIEVTENTIIDFDVTDYDSCAGKLIVYTNYQYLDTVSAAQLRFKMSFVTHTGEIYPTSDPWDQNRNKIYLFLFRFTKNPVTITNVSSPNFYYIEGSKHVYRGQLNFSPEEPGAPVPPDYFTFVHDYNSTKIAASIYNELDQLVSADQFQVLDNNSFKLTVDSYRPFPDTFHLCIGNPADNQLFTIYSSNFVNYQYTLQHNLGSQDIHVNVYDENGVLITPKRVQCTTVNTILFDFSNLKEDLAGLYNIIITNVNIYKYTLEVLPTDEVLTITHNLTKKYVNIQVQDSLNNIININNNPIFDVSDKNVLTIILDSCALSPSNVYKVLIYENTSLVYNFDTNGNVTYPCQYYIKDFTKENLDAYNKLTVYHNMNVNFPQVYIYDIYKNLVTPDSVQVLDSNSVIVDVTSLGITTETYTAVIYASDQEVVNANTIDRNLDGGSSSSVVFDTYVNCGYSITTPTSGDIVYDGGGSLQFETKIFSFTINKLRIQTPMFQFYTPSLYSFVPDEFKKIADNTYLINTTSYVDMFNYYIVYSDGYSRYSLAFADENILYGKLTVTHNLNTLYPVVQIWNSDNVSVKPDSIKITSLNQIEVTLSTLQPLVGQYTIEVFGGNICITNQTVDYSNIIGILDTDPTLSSNSNLNIPSQRAVKSYIDSIVLEQSTDLSVLQTDYAYIGKYLSKTAGDTFSFGEIGYLASDGKIYKATTDDVDKLSGFLVIALNNISATTTGIFGVPSVYVNNPVLSLTIGAPIYLNGTSISLTPPVSGYSRSLGYALDVKIINFNPSPEIFAL